MAVLTQRMKCLWPANASGVMWARPRVVTTPEVPMVARSAGARQWWRCDEVYTLSSSIVWHGGQAMPQRLGLTGGVGHR
jgi:hypothetical protein